mgnify:CR=1 FL=1
MISAVKEPIPHFYLWKAYREKDDLESQEILVKQYIYLVDQMANRLSKSIPLNLIPREDLVGMGNIGLLEAIKKFDYKKGYQFETYGLWRIKGAMLDGLRQMDWVPRGLREKAKKLTGAQRELEQKLMRPPSEEELSQYLDLPAEDVKQGMSVLSVSTLLSLNEPVHALEEGKQQSRLDQLEDANATNQEQLMQRDEFRKLLAECIDKMPEKERLVITLMYFEELSQVEIAEILGLTKGRISQIHSQAINRFRKFLETKGYSLYSFF